MGYFLYFIIFIISAIFGSFFNMLIYRIPRKISFKSLLDRSFCPKCKHKLSFLDLIPILSYIFLKGKCRYCKKPIPIRYFLVEIITPIIFILIFLKYKTFNSIYLYLDIFIASIFILIFFIDLETMIIPDILVILIFILSFFKKLSEPKIFDQILFSFIWGFVWFLFFYLVFYLTKGKGMGFGDVKYAFVLGFLFKEKSFYLIPFSFAIGGIFSIFLVIFKKISLKEKIPFGPFLSLSSILFLIK